MQNMKWTKRCENGAECVAAFDHNPQTAAFIPDSYHVCDPCLRAKYELHSIYDSHDFLGMSPLYRERDVVAALRKAEHLTNED